MHHCIPSLCSMVKKMLMLTRYTYLQNRVIELKMNANCEIRFFKVESVAAVKLQLFMVIYSRASILSSWIVNDFCG